MHAKTPPPQLCCSVPFSEGLTETNACSGCQSLSLPTSPIQTLDRTNPYAYRSDLRRVGVLAGSSPVCCLLLCSPPTRNRARAAHSAAGVLRQSPACRLCRLCGWRRHWYRCPLRVQLGRQSLRPPGCGHRRAAVCFPGRCHRRVASIGKVGGKPCRRSSHHCFMPRGCGITGAASCPGNGATAKSCHAVTCATQFGLTQVLDLMNKILAVTYLFLASSAVSYAQPAKRNADSMTFLCADSLNRADGQPRKQTYCKIGSEYCYEATGGPALSHGAQCKPLPTDNPSCSGIPLLPGGSCSGNRSTGIYVRFAFP